MRSEPINIFIRAAFPLFILDFLQFPAKKFCKWGRNVSEKLPIDLSNSYLVQTGWSIIKHRPLWNGAARISGGILNFHHGFRQFACLAPAFFVAMLVMKGFGAL
ncbi:MAG: hypothetical protein ABSF60_00800 [Verrucomicrobiota bacterium]